MISRAAMTLYMIVYVGMTDEALLGILTHVLIEDPPGVCIVIWIWNAVTACHNVVRRDIVVKVSAIVVMRKFREYRACRGIRVRWRCHVVNYRFYIWGSSGSRHRESTG
jgi:hypothetical protein